MTDYKPRDNEAIIYIAQSKLNKSEVYIGKTHQSFFQRMEQHIASARKGDGTRFHEALVNTGFSNWNWQILEVCERAAEFEKERHYIDKFHAHSISLLNTTNNKQSNQDGAKAIVKTHRGSTNKDAQSDLYRRQSGVLKPVKNLDTNKVYKSLAEAAELENLSKSTIRLSCRTGKALPNGSRFAFLGLDDEPIMTDGHLQKHIIGRNAKKIKNLVTGKVFVNVDEAAKQHSVSSSAISANASGKSFTVKDKWVFCYLNKNDEELLSEKHRQGLTRLSKVTVNKYVAWRFDDDAMQNTLRFKNLTELCDGLGITGKAHVKSVCEGNRSHVEGWRIAYLSGDGEPILTKQHHMHVKKLSRRVVCLNDNRQFDSISAAGSFYGVIAGQIAKCANGEAKSVRCKGDRLRFAYMDENGNPIMTSSHHEGLDTKGKYRLIHIQSGKVYNSLNAFCRATQVPKKRALKFLNGEEENLLGNEFIPLKD